MSSKISEISLRTNKKGGKALTNNPEHHSCTNIDSWCTLFHGVCLHQGNLRISDKERRMNRCKRKQFYCQKYKRSEKMTKIKSGNKEFMMNGIVESKRRDETERKKQFRLSQECYSVNFQQNQVLHFSTYKMVSDMLTKTLSHAFLEKHLSFLFHLSFQKRGVIEFISSFTLAVSKGKDLILILPQNHILHFSLSLLQHLFTLSGFFSYFWKTNDNLKKEASAMLYHFIFLIHSSWSVLSSSPSLISFILLLTFCSSRLVGFLLMSCASLVNSSSLLSSKMSALKYPIHSSWFHPTITHPSHCVSGLLVGFLLASLDYTTTRGPLLALACQVPSQRCSHKVVSRMGSVGSNWCVFMTYMYNLCCIQGDPYLKIIISSPFRLFINGRYIETQHKNLINENDYRTIKISNYNKIIIYF
ncbi:hypothetical protein VP01_415g1 [Puccinia sorghi]|uniref:Uncharacterized protein n=1 Tax=Puccinia sorghi TaxID=27349 RepID=A0A0L6UQY4_9BASI|nr:hypothetical protein VP01_415g1 [Puccinia sorghi]